MSAVLLDVDGVLHISGRPIDGAADALRRLRDAGHRLRLLTNNTTQSRLALAAALFGLTLRRGAKDPVCGMTVDRRAGKPTSTYDGRTYYFCGEGCKAKFDAEPDRYVDAIGRQAVALEHAGHER